MFAPKGLGYDRGSTIFSPDGRLFQVEYAIEAVKRGTTAVGIKTAEGCILAVQKRLHTTLIEKEMVKKIFALLAIIVFLGSSPVLFSEDIELEYVSSILWTQLHDVEIEGDYAYCAFLNGLMILDVSNK